MFSSKKMAGVLDRKTNFITIRFELSFVPERLFQVLTISLIPGTLGSCSYKQSFVHLLCIVGEC